VDNGRDIRFSSASLPVAFLVRVRSQSKRNGQSSDGGVPPEVGEVAEGI
jgi:hypothetical protein